MAEYIDRDAFIAHIRKDPLFGMVEQYGITGVIKAFPAADVQPVVHGKWIKNEGIGVQGVGWHCSVCKENDVWAFIDKGEKTQDDLYCPNCGAKMDGGDVK